MEQDERYRRDFVEILSKTYFQETFRICPCHVVREREMGNGKEMKGRVRLMRTDDNSHLFFQISSAHFLLLLANDALQNGKFC